MKLRFGWLNWLLGSLLALAALFLATFSPNIDLLSRPLRVQEELHRADVIVVLSAGLVDTCEPRDTLLDREFRGVDLLKRGYSRSGKIIFTGRYVDERMPAEQCRRILERRFDLPPGALILDNQATSTYENALNTHTILKRHGWGKPLLVTSVSHMKRAMLVFAKQGMSVYPAMVVDRPDPGKYWFHINRVAHIHRFLYEYGALFTYRWYGYI